MGISGTAGQLREERLPEEDGRPCPRLRPTSGPLAVAGDPLRVVKAIEPEIQKVLVDKTKELTTELSEALSFATRAGRVDIFELCCTESSALSQSVIDQGGSARRMGLWNGYDFAKASAV